MESLARAPELIDVEISRPQIQSTPRTAPASTLSVAAAQYADLFLKFRHARVAPAKAPVPDDLKRRVRDIKGGIYFLNAAHAGICETSASAWFEATEPPDHGFAIVIAVEVFRRIEPNNLASEWLEGAYHDIGATRAAGIAANVANYLGQIGYAATAHSAGASEIDIDRLAVISGICYRTESGDVASPFLDRQIVLAAVTTDYEMATDLPILPAGNRNRGFRYWLGINGAESGRERQRRMQRSTELSAYPMEQVKRVDKPTTLILEDEVPRVPHRASFFERPQYGDLGPKAQRERQRFAFKTPSAQSYIPLIRAMVPLQTNEIAAEQDPALKDRTANSRAIKSLGYALGADLIGICEIPEYAWYSHHNDGKPITPYHKYAIVMLIDQGYDTMEGASGDDWISGSQSMRAYMRGAEIAGIMSRFLCDKGYSTRPQTNVLSHVLHIPLILLAGLGELSRIGELVLNPFVGPRFKSVVVTTDLPLEVDKPIDFGLQYFCSQCLKCARECPCDAIPVTDKIMFNGYAMWKIDAERCARYRITNPRGAGCGRCMKTCPLNKVPNADGSLLTRIASWLGVNAMWLKPLMVPLAVKIDDWLGNGKRNLVKKWWLDLEVVDGVSIEPVAGVHQRDIEPGKKLRTKEKIVYYHASLMPPPDSTEPVAADRKHAKDFVNLIETPTEACRRKAAGIARPEHYIPVKCLDPQNDLPE